MTDRRWVLADAFDRAAPSYDAMVALSPGYHDQLATAARALIARMPGRARIVDLGCGSGASTHALIEAWRADGRDLADLDLVGVDASEGMIAQARAKSWPGQVSFVVADAVAWLEEQGERSADGALAAYLLRNVPDRDRLVGAVARLLRPGGGVVLHEYSVAGNRRARATWAAVCHAIIVPLAAVKRSDVPLHRYLYRSVRDFDTIPVVLDRLERAGFTQVTTRTYPGWQQGMIHTVAGVRR